MNKALKIGISIASIALLIGFFLLPESTRQEIVAEGKQVNEQTMQLIQSYCSNSLDVPREYLVAKIKEKFPDYPAEGICGLYEHHDPG